MKKERLLLIALAIVSVVVMIWAVQLNGSCQSLKNKKIEVENKLSQALKDKDFIRAQLDDLENKLEVETQGNRSLAEQLDQAKSTIEEFQKEIMSLTQAKQDLEKELSAFKEKKPEETVKSPEVIKMPEIPALPESPGPAQQESPAASETVMPLSQ